MKYAEVSEEHVASICRVEDSAKQDTRIKHAPTLLFNSSIPVTRIFYLYFCTDKFIPQANYTDRSNTTTGEVSANFCEYRAFRGQRNGTLPLLISLCRPEPLLLPSSSSSIILTRLSGPRSRPAPNSLALSPQANYTE
jgi:hypothetical protein